MEDEVRNILLLGDVYVMNNKQIYETAKKQSAIDLNCHIDDFDKDHNVIVASQSSLAARKYLELPLACDLVSYGNNIVASIDLNMRKL